MKFIMLLIITISNAHAKDFCESYRGPQKERICSIDNIRVAMSLCEIKVPNEELFKKQLTLPENSQTLKCLEGKKDEVKMLVLGSKNRATKKYEARLFIKGYDCSTLRGFSQAICWYMK